MDVLLSWCCHGVVMVLSWCCHDVVVVSHPPPPCCHCITATSLLLLLSCRGNRHMHCVIIVIVVWTCYHRCHIAPTSSLLSLHRSHLIIIIVSPWQSPCALCHRRCAGVDMPSLTSLSSPSHLCRLWPLRRCIGVMVGSRVVALVVATSSMLVVAWLTCCHHCCCYVVAIVLLLLLSCCSGIHHAHCVVIVGSGRGGRSRGCHHLVYW